MSTKLDVFEKDGKKFPILKLINDETGKLGLTFGIAKAKLIVGSYEDILKFVDDNKK